MARFILTARAEDDLSEIWLYIARDNPIAADGLLNTIDRACAQLAEYPKLGPVRPDIAADLRYSIVGRYLILYREIMAGIVRLAEGHAQAMAS